MAKLKMPGTKMSESILRIKRLRMTEMSKSKMTEDKVFEAFC